MRSDQEKWVTPFVAALEEAQRRDDRATLAALRRGLTAHPAERDMWVYAHLRGAAARHEEAALQMASLFALHPKPGGTGSVGAAFQRMRTDSTSESLDKRFALLLDSHPDDLPARLRQAVSLLRAGEVPVGWRQLMLDLLDWERAGRPVQRRWARDYWASRRDDADPGETATADTAAGSRPDQEGD